MTVSTMTTGQKVYNFLFIQNWINVVTSIGLFGISSFVGNLTFIMSLFMLVNASILILGNFIKNVAGVTSSENNPTGITHAGSASLDVLDIRKYIIFANSSMITFFVIALINMPFIGYIITMIPFVETLLFALVAIAGYQLNTFLLFVGMFLPTNIVNILQPLNITVGEVPAYFLNKSEYSDFLLSIISLYPSVFGSISKNALNVAINKITSNMSPEQIAQIQPLIQLISNLDSNQIIQHGHSILKSLSKLSTANLETLPAIVDVLMKLITPDNKLIKDQ